MKNTRLLLATCLCCLCSVGAWSQQEQFDRPLETKNHVSQPSQSAIRTANTALEVRPTQPESYPAKSLPEGYTGFRIEIIVSDTLLPDTSEVFFQHGNIIMEIMPDNHYHYTIGDFQEEVAAKNFMQQFITPRYEEPRIVRYQSGKRL